MSPTLPRRLVAEGTATAMLAAVVVGSGIMAERLTDDRALQLLVNSTATGAVLVALILAFGWVSGAHLNPVVTAAEVALGGLPRREGAAYAAVQVAGACLGTVVANVMFDLPAVTTSTHERSGTPLWVAEVVATAGLLLVILGVVRSGRAHQAAYAVAGYIAAAYWFTSSTSFANPAITIGRALTDTFAGIAPSSVPAFVAAQAVGGTLALLLAGFTFHQPQGTELVVDHLDPTRGGPS
ncbi:MAG: aquaporin family protein [Acidimicrobiales bacterium]|nr:aquaporin family protein [Acidimicrobiales bacterium]HRW38298.1 MIP/aquaporin family protein [Aquihabitans sp.]